MAASLDELPIDEMVEERVKLASLQARIPPTQITVLPNCKQVLFLGPNYKTMSGYLSLQIMNLEDNNDNKWGQTFDFTSISNLSTELSLEQKLLRERKRTSSHGITSYSYHKETNQVLFEYGPYLVISKIPKEITEYNSVPVIKIGNSLNDNIGTRMDANLTADGSFIIFARNDDLWITTSRPNLLSDENDKNNVSEIQLTFAQNINKDITAGVADFINQEEFDRFTGYWLSPNYIDIKHENKDYRQYSILYLEANNSKVPTITIPSMDGIEQHKWPRSGETNCSFKVKIVTIDIALICCAQITDNEELKNINNINNNNVIINDYQLKQSIYSSFNWIEYIVRSGWTSRNNECWIQYLDRDQMRSNLVLYQFDKHFMKSSNNNYENNGIDEKTPEIDDTLNGEELFHSNGTPWINIHDAYKFINNGLIWASEHSGFRHLYFIPFPKDKNEKIDLSKVNIITINDENDEQKIDATKVNMTFVTPSSCNVQQLTFGKWEIEDESIWFHQKTNTVYFRGRRETHLEKHLYSLQFDPLKQTASISNDEYKINKLTESGYFHDTNVDSINFQFFSSIYSSISKPRQFAIYSIDGKCIKQFTVPYRGNPKLLKYVEPQIESITNFPSNATEQEKENKDYINLHTFSVAIYPPFDEEYQKTKQWKAGGYPTIISVYGGPHVQLITNSWDRITGNPRCQLWRTLGYTVAIIDSRGSYHRGLAFEGRIKYKMGQIEIDDQVKLVQYLIKRGLTNPKQVAITGYSYGGYMSLMALCQRPDIFQCGIAGAPVTLWSLYDTGYTERYMGTPKKHKNAYNNGSVLKYVQNFPNQENRVVIIHGLGDENVHFYHTSKLIQAMIKHNKPYNLKIFPGERHGIRQWDNVLYMEKLYISHFQKMIE